MTQWRCAVLLGALMATLAGSTATAPAQATVLYQYHAFCEVACSNVGLAYGDGVDGVIGFSDASFALGLAQSPADVDYFDLHFGVLDFTLSSLGFAFALFTPPTQEAFAFAFVANTAASEPGYAFAQNAWIAGTSVLDAAYGGSGTLRRVVPEPAPWQLLAAGVAPWLMRRRGVAARYRSQDATASRSSA